jgi:hypothetical protein
MIKPLTDNVNVRNVAAPASAKKSGPTSPAADKSPQDQVVLSSKAQTQLRVNASIQEASETPAQTAKEAQHGDLQAKRLLEKQAGARKVSVPAKR